MDWTFMARCLEIDNDDDLADVLADVVSNFSQTPRYETAEGAWEAARKEFSEWFTYDIDGPDGEFDPGQFPSLGEEFQTRRTLQPRDEIIRYTYNDGTYLVVIFKIQGPQPWRS